MKKKPRKTSRVARNTPQASFITLVRITLGAFVFVLFSSFVVSSSQPNSTLGVTTYLAKDDGGNSGSSGSGSSGSGSGSDSDKDGDDNDSSGSSGNGSSGSSAVTPVKTETRDPQTGIRTQTEIKQDEARTEVRLSETERIRTRIKDGETRIDITSGGIKTRLEQEDDRVVIKAEREDGTEVELEDDTIFKIDDRLDASGIKVATAAAGRFIVQKGTIGAVTNFPISIDLATNSLFINTPSGQRSVAVLPEQAVQNMLAANVVSRLGGQAIVDEATKGNLTGVSDIIALGDRDGVPVYEIPGVSDQRLLGFIPVSIEKTVVVSAQTGEVIGTDAPLGVKIVDLLSF